MTNNLDKKFLILLNKPVMSILIILSFIFIFLSSTNAFVPNDSSFSFLWGLHNTGQTGGINDADIDAVEAWDLTTGSDQIIVAVLDSGIDYNHPDLADNLWINENEIPNNGIDDDSNGYIDDYRGWDFFNNDNDPFDDNGHGTHVAGIIGAKGNNSMGVSGVNHNVGIMNLKFIGSNNVGTVQGAIDAIDYAILMEADVMSNSWIVSQAWNEPGWNQPGFGPDLKAAIDRANQAGILFVTGTGNFNVDLDQSPRYPASYDNENVITVAATDENDLLWDEGSSGSSSNYGLITVEIGAPGNDIYSTVPIGSCKYCDPSGYKYVQGGSMSTAYTSGSAALIKSYYSNITLEQLIARIKYNGDNLPSLQGKTNTGKRLNVYNSLENDINPPNSIVDLSSIDRGTNYITIQWTSVGDDGIIGTASSYDIRYSLNPIDENNFNNALKVNNPPNPLASGSNEQYSVSELQANTTYYFAIKSIDNVGNIAGISNIILDTTNPLSTIDLNPQSLWKLDETTGLVASDATGNGNDGILINGPVWTSSGQIDGSLDFDGSNDFVRVDPSPMVMNNWNQITVSAWVKNDIGSGAGADDIIGWWNYPSSKSWILTHHNNNKYFWEISGKGNVAGGIVSTNWAHVAGTYDGSVMRLYVNGVEVASKTGLSGNLPFSSADLIIGSQDDGSNYFNGLIDDVGIWDRALNSSEISEIYSNGLSGIGVGGQQPFCGDGNIDLGEQCDDNNTLSGDGCNDQCEIENCNVSNDCDDGLFCNGAESCMNFVCEIGVTVVCNDNVSCTVDSCNEATDSCDNAVNHSICDDGLFCNGAEFCDHILDCQAGNQQCTGPGESCDENLNMCLLCSFTDAYWITTNTVEGTIVDLIVEGQNCNSLLVDFEVWENDVIEDDPININPISVNFVGNSAVTSWVAEWQDDGIGDPEYYFISSLDSDPSIYMQSNNILSVSPAPECSNGIDDDSDGFIDSNDFSCQQGGEFENSFLSECQDGIDNDLDNLTDLNDPGCDNNQDNDELDFDINLQSLWKLDETTGLAASDATGNGNDGILINGPVWSSSGQIDGSLDFDGNNDYFVINDFDLSNNFPGKNGGSTEEMTFIAWIKQDTLRYQMIAAKDKKNARSFNFAVSGNGNLVPQFYNPSGTGTTNIVGGVNIGTGTWKHIAIIYDYDLVIGSANVSIYVDGVLDTVSSGVVGPIAGTLTEFNVGRRAYSPYNNYFDGMIDDVRIYDKAMISQEVNDLYNQGSF